jgi:hypothetical protein
MVRGRISSNLEKSVADRSVRLCQHRHSRQHRRGSSVVQSEDQNWTEVVRFEVNIIRELGNWKVPRHPSFLLKIKRTIVLLVCKCISSNHPFIYPSIREYLRGKYRCIIDLLFDRFRISFMATDNFCFYLQNRLYQTSQKGGQRYSDTSPFSIPCIYPSIRLSIYLSIYPFTYLYAKHCTVALFLFPLITITAKSIRAHIYNTSFSL